ncbi:MAG: hypothetical protein LQ349_000617 [Xanthoria aureola]|nr:MAG: hypothetical protein LQ349_000617 [Xanthoria aureola]
MLQYLYGMDYLKEPENDDTFSMFGSQKKPSKKHRKRSERSDEPIWRDDEPTPHGDESLSSEQGPDCSTEIEPRGNATIHAQMCAVAGYYGIPGLQEVARRKFRVGLVKIRDLQGIVKLFKLVCNPQFRSDAVLRDIMVDKVVKHNSLLDYAEVEEILHDDGELGLAIAKRMH